MSRAGLVRGADRYELTGDNAVLRLSALALMRQVVGMTNVLPRHHREQISLALWKWTEAFGQPPHAKYNLRFVSKGVMEAEADARINHEHVFPRKWIVERLLDLDPDSPEFENFLDDHGAACVVTVEEHGELGNASGPGWMRYVKAGVEVYDRVTGQYVDPATLMPALPSGVDRIVAPEPSLGSGQPAAGAAKWDLVELVNRRCGSSRAPLLLRLARSATLALGVTMPQRSATVPTYFRVHDTLVEEPTRAAAYVNLNGKADLALSYDELPERMRGLEWVKSRSETHKPYLVRCTVTDDRSLETAEDLLVMALARIREQYST